MRFVIFIDALDEHDLSPWMREHLITQYDPGVPKVTPNVISQIMTGKRQEDMRFVRSTPYKQQRTFNINDQTILHYATVERGLKILQYGIPLCANVNLPPGSMSTYDHFLQGNQNVPPLFQFARDNHSFADDKPDLIFNAYVDQTAAMMATFRTIARNGQFDMIWIGYQFADAYTHWYNREDRMQLLMVLEEELKCLSIYGEIMFFSDHGSTDRKHTFFMNKWLAKHGFLKYKIYEDLIKYNIPTPGRFPDQIVLESPFVTIDWDKTKFFSVDAFDAMVDATDNAKKSDIKRLKKELMETGHFNDVLLRNEVFDPDGDEFDFCPAVMPDAKEHVVVSSNIHKDAEKGNNLEGHRNGWHSNRGVVGCTDNEPFNTEINGPRDIFHFMKEFVDRQKPESRGHAGVQNEVIAAIFDEMAYI